GQACDRLSLLDFVHASGWMSTGPGRPASRLPQDPVQPVERALVEHRARPRLAVRAGPFRRGEPGELLLAGEGVEQPGIVEDHGPGKKRAILASGTRR